MASPRARGEERVLPCVLRSSCVPRECEITSPPRGERSSAARVRGGVSAILSGAIEASEEAATPPSSQPSPRTRGEGSVRCHACLNATCVRGVSHPIFRASLFRTVTMAFSQSRLAGINYGAFAGRYGEHYAAACRAALLERLDMLATVLDTAVFHCAGNQHPVRRRSDAAARSRRRRYRGRRRCRFICFTKRRGSACRNGFCSRAWPQM